jgi:hypothetical protein
VSDSDPEVILVLADVTHRDCTWSLEFEWSSEERSGTLRVDDRGRLFHTAATTEGGPITFMFPPPTQVLVNRQAGYRPNGNHESRRAEPLTPVPVSGAAPARLSQRLLPVVLLVGGDAEPRWRQMFDAGGGRLPEAHLVVLPGQRPAAHQTAPELFAATLRQALAAPPGTTREAS